jgi:hypothetical protein
MHRVIVITTDRSWSLFDLDVDPREADDVAREHVDLVIRPRADLRAWLADAAPGLGRSGGGP